MKPILFYFKCFFSRNNALQYVELKLFEQFSFYLHLNATWCCFFFASKLILRISIEIFNRNQRMFLFLGRAGADGIPGKDGRDGTPGCNTNLKLFSKLNTQADDHN